ncbi:MAG: hydratase [Hyphomicrobiales bacterium]
MGSVFSPYYAWARRRGAADPDNHCALNVALYGSGGHRWSMTERGRRSVTRKPDRFVVGPSRMQWRDGVLVIDIDEVTVPIPGRLRGQVRLRPRQIFGHTETLDAESLHRWRPVSPVAEVEADFSSPRLAWSGDGYHDMNWGSAPLENSFADWTWSRATTRSGAHVTYDTIRRDGSRNAFALRFQENGSVEHEAVPASHALPRGFWRMQRHAHSEGNARLVSTLEDAPFYARSLVEAQIGGERVTAFHESLSLTKFSMPLIQAMLPFRMPRRA